MKTISYTFADGTVSEHEVSDELSAAIAEMETQERRNNKRETRRHTSLDYLSDKGIDLDTIHKVTRIPMKKLQSYLDADTMPRYKMQQEGIAKALGTARIELFQEILAAKGTIDKQNELKKALVATRPEVLTAAPSNIQPHERKVARTLETCKVCNYKHRRKAGFVVPRGCGLEVCLVNGKRT